MELVLYKILIIVNKIIIYKRVQKIIIAETKYEKDQNELINYTRNRYKN